MVESAGRRARLQDPEPRVPRLEALAQQVLTGDIVLPKFQREFVWTPQKTLDLLDSVARNYPIGSVLLWQTADQQFASERTVADLDVDPPRVDYPVNYVLDGQQRIASICGALYWTPDDDPNNRWNIGYDLQSETFCQLDHIIDLPEHVLPVRLLSDASEYFGRVSEIRDPDLTALAKTLFDRFTNYQVAVVTLRDLPVSEVAKIFERINSTHTQLTIVDLMRAATWSPQFDLRDEIDVLREVLDRKHYGGVDDVTLLRAISASAGFGFSNDDARMLRTLPEEVLRRAVDEAGEAAKRAVDFLVTDIGTPTAKALPYLGQFAVLVEIFRQVPKPTSAQHESIKRWFWLTASGSYFSSWSNRQMSADRDAVAAFAGSTVDVDVSTALPIDKLWINSQFRIGNAPSKLLGLLLADASPVDLRSGQRIDVGKAPSWQNDKEFHHLFPRAFLTRIGISPRRANVCANLIMLTSVTNIFISDQRPSAYLADLCESDGEAVVRQRLARSLVDDAAFEAARRDDYEGFLHARSQTLHEHLMRRIGLEG